MLNSQHDAQLKEHKDTFLLSPMAENALAEIAHDRFEIKHQLVLHAFIAQRQKPFRDHNDNEDPELEKHLNIDALAKLYMFLHELDYEENITSEITEELRHGRINFLQRQNISLQQHLTRVIEEKEVLEARIHEFENPIYAAS